MDKIDWGDEEECLAAVRESGGYLKYIRNQTPKICLEAVKENGIALNHVKEQTYEICLEAVKQTCYALPYVELRFRTRELCEIALFNFKNTGYLWATDRRYILRHTPEEYEDIHRAWEIMYG